MDSFFKKIDKTVNLDYLYSLFQEENNVNINFTADTMLFEFNYFAEIATTLNIDVGLVKKLWLVQYFDSGVEKQFASSENYSVALCLPTLNIYNTLVLKIDNIEVECLIDKPVLFLSTTPARFKIPDSQSIIIGFSDSIVNIADIEPFLM